MMNINFKKAILNIIKKDMAIAPLSQVETLLSTITS